MSRGLRTCEKIITNSVGIVEGHTNVNKENADLHITIPLLKTVGTAQIAPSLTFCNSHSSDVGLFGKGIRLNYFKSLNTFDNSFYILNSDYSKDLYVLQEENIAKCKKKNTTCKKIFVDEYELDYYYEVMDKFGNAMQYATIPSEYPNLISMKNGERFSFDFVSEIKTISNENGDIVKFSGTNNIELVEYFHQNNLVYKTRLFYDDENYISRVVCYN